MLTNNLQSGTRQARGRIVAASLLCGAALALATSLPAQTRKADRLYEGSGVSAGSVRQGKLGSCYFHAVIAAMAQSRPDTVRIMIHDNADKTYTVQFADGKKEIAYAEDIKYSRDSGYDKSDGLWVAVLFRAYAQRVLRESMAAALGQTDLFAVVKHYAEELINSNDSVLLAYDRAIRRVADQDGHIDRARLSSQLNGQMTVLSIPNSMKESMLKLLDSEGFLASLETSIKQNGELFGAYRAVGQGGIAGRVMEVFAGSKSLTENESDRAVASVLSRGARMRAPMVACTGGSRYHEMRAQHQPLPASAGPWYIDSHCYTVMGYDAGGQTVTLRNPWGDQPYPDGFLSLPLSSFVPGFVGVVTTAQ